jgi:hypothetical protein
MDIEHLEEEILTVGKPANIEETIQSLVEYGGLRPLDILQLSTIEDINSDVFYSVRDNSPYIVSIYVEAMSLHDLPMRLHS